MRKTIFITLCALSINGLWAQELPKWAKKAKKAVFSVITYNADNKILNTGNGFYIDSEGIGVSDYSLFKGAHRAVVVTADGKELPVTLILGANDMYDVVRFKTETAKKQESLATASTPGKENDKVYVMPYSTQNSVKETAGTIQKIDSIGKNSFYYTLSMKTGVKDVSCPLMNENGEVIGLIQRNSGSEDEKSYALGINYAKSLSINALSGSDTTLKSIKIKKGLPDDESQALVFLYMMSSQLEDEEYLSILNDFINMYPKNMEGYLRRATYYMGKNSEEHINAVEGPEKDCGGSRKQSRSTLRNCKTDIQLQYKQCEEIGESRLDSEQSFERNQSSFIRSRRRAVLPDTGRYLFRNEGLQQCRYSLRKCMQDSPRIGSSILFGSQG